MGHTVFIEHGNEKYFNYNWTEDVYSNSVMNVSISSHQHLLANIISTQLKKKKVRLYIVCIQIHPYYNSTDN